MATFSYYPTVGVMKDGFAADIPNHLQLWPSQLYVLVMPGTIRGMKPRYDDSINAFVQTVSNYGGKVIWYDRATGLSLLVFAQDQAEVQLWCRDGTIHHLVRWGDAIKRLPLTELDVAQRRTEQLRDQLETNNDLKRRHGVMAGAFRLLKLATSVEAVDVIVDFLADVQSELPTQLRANIYAELLKRKHAMAATFSEGGAVVLLFARPKHSGPPASRKAKLAARAQRDAELRREARGGSGGQPKSQKQSGRKGK